MCARRWVGSWCWLADRRGDAAAHSPTATCARDEGVGAAWLVVVRRIAARVTGSTPSHAHAQAETCAQGSRRLPNMAMLLLHKQAIVFAYPDPSPDWPKRTILDDPLDAHAVT